MAPSPGDRATRGISPASATLAAAAGACRSLVSTSRQPPCASQSGAPPMTRRTTSSPSPPPSSVTRGSCSRASAGIIAISAVGTYGALAASTSTRPRSAAGSGW